MRCFLCHCELTIAALSIVAHFQPPEDVDEHGHANFCFECTRRLDAAIQDFRR